MIARALAVAIVACFVTPIAASEPIDLRPTVTPQ